MDAGSGASNTSSGQCLLCPIGPPTDSKKEKFVELRRTATMGESQEWLGLSE
jgi:hypothetical protein